MFEQLRKKSVKSSIPLFIMMLVIGLGLCAYQFSNVVSAIKGHAVLSELTPEEIEYGMVVDASIETNNGAFMEMYKKNTSTGKKTTTSLYYIISMDPDNNPPYMAVRVPVSMEDEMEKMADNTFARKYSDPIQISGTIKKMTSSEEKYFISYMKEFGYTEQEVKDMMIPYYIYHGKVGDMVSEVVYVIFGCGALLTIWSIIYIIRVTKGSKLKKIRKEIAESGYTEEQVDADWASSSEILTNDVMKIGQVFTYVNDGVPHAIKKDRLVWAYMKTTTHKTNGITTGTTYSVIMFTKDNKEFAIDVKDEAAARHVLNEMGNRMPWMLLGYDDELRRCYKRNINEFLDIRYNKIEKM